MRASTLLLTAALSLGGTASFAQSSYNVVVEPVEQSVDSIINAPIEYDENGVVKAQHFNADDLTEAQYQALLDEAERIKAYRNANGLNFDDQYVYPETKTATVVETAPSYQIELFAPQTSSEASTATTMTDVKTHTVSKGDTLYNISKRYDVSIPAIRTENGLTGNALSIGQRIRIPGVIVETVNTTVSQPVFASAPVQQGYVTRRVINPVPAEPTPEVQSADTSEAIYAVLPKDTLYSISRRTCVAVDSIISRNAIANPDSLKPGQRLTLPSGHCLYR